MLLWSENLKSFKHASKNTLSDLRGCIKSVNVLCDFRIGLVALFISKDNLHGFLIEVYRRNRFRKLHINSVLNQYRP